MNKVIIQLLFIIMIVSASCRKTTSTSGTGSTGSGTVSVKITDTKGSSTVTIKPSSLLGFFWTGGNGYTLNGYNIPGFHAINSDQVVFSLDFAPQIKSYTRATTVHYSNDREVFALSCDVFSNSFFAKDGTLNITKIVTGFDSVSYRNTYTITANWSGTLFDSVRNRTVNGVITWNSAKFE